MKKFESESIIGIYALEQGGAGETRVELRDAETGATRWVIIPQGIGAKMLEDIVIKAQKALEKREELQAKEAAKLEAERVKAEEAARKQSEAEAAELEGEKGDAQ